MKKFAIILGLLIISSFIYVVMQANPPVDMPPSNPSHPLVYVGSIGTDTDKVTRGSASFKENYAKLDSLSLYWYNLDSDNDVSRDGSVSDENEEDIIAFAKENNKKVLVGIGDHGEAERADEILEDEDLRNDHFDEIMTLLDEKGYDGVIIDYENLSNNQEEKFTNYMEQLSEELKSNGKMLGISIPVETEGKVTHGINIEAVSKIVDRMHMNIYEQHGADSGPGPIASIDWTNTIIKNAIDQGVSPNKIVLGTAHSGHDWIVSPDEEFFKDMHTKETLELLNRTKANLKWDRQKQANYFEYTDGENRKHIVWLEDAESIKTKIDLAKRYKLQGLFIWYLGGEDPKFWDAL